MDTYFSVNNDDLKRLNSQEAVEVFQMLLHAEARRIGIPISKINISLSTNVPDGGIDAHVDTSVQIKEDLIKNGDTSYQIKTGEDFKPWTKSVLKKELFIDNKKPISKTNLKTGIINSLDNFGTYIIVTYYHDLTDPQKRKGESILKGYLTSCEYRNTKVEVWSQNQLKGFLCIYPSLCLFIKKRIPGDYQTHLAWSNNEEMRKPFIPNDEQGNLIINLRVELLKSDGFTHLHIRGEPGIGKTRIVYEITKLNQIAPFILYFSDSQNFISSDLFYELSIPDNQYNIVLVLDECDITTRAIIKNRLSSNNRIKIITIYNEFENTTGDIKIYDAPLLRDEKIKEIIQSYNIPADQAERWVPYCSGFPRVAHIFGLNLKKNPNDPLANPDTIQAWDRYITGGDKQESSEVKQRTLVLRHIALFKKFGFGKSVNKEAYAIVKIIGDVDPSFTIGKLEEIVHTLRRRKILQGDYTLYITPKALHIKLWIDYWEIYGSSFDYRDFIQKLDGKLLSWFHDMFKYAKSSSKASKIIDDILSEHGVFEDDSYLQTEEGARLFSALAEANPHSSLTLLQRTVGNWDKDRRLKFTTGRREVVWALEKIVMRRELFSEGAEILLKLAEAENETYSNNATGIFAGLFTLGYGKVAPTEASPKERFPLLERLIKSENQKERYLGLSACAEALESRHFNRTIGAEYQGLQKEPELWKPKTYGELYDAYRFVWNLVLNEIESVTPDEREYRIDLILDKSQGIILVQNLAEMVLDTFESWLAKDYCPKKKMLGIIIRILRYNRNNLIPKHLERLSVIKVSLIGDDYSSQLDRYVGMNIFEDDIDKNGNRINRTQIKISELAREGVSKSEILIQELPWLVGSNSPNVYRFGFEVGKIDIDSTIINQIIRKMKLVPEPTVSLIGGYCRALYESDQEKWNEILIQLSKDKKLVGYIPELIWRTGINDKSVSLLLKLFEKNVVDPNSLKIFRVGRFTDNLSEELLINFIEVLVDNNLIHTAIEIYHDYYSKEEMKGKLNRDFTKHLLTHKNLLKACDVSSMMQTDDFYWEEIAKLFIKQYPDDRLLIAAFIIENIGEKDSIFESIHNASLGILTEITKADPKGVWDILNNILISPLDRRMYALEEWLRGERSFSDKISGALYYFNPEQIWEWIEEDIENRAREIAEIVPKVLFKSTENVCLVRELLVKYGDRKDVRNSLIANFCSEGWTGPSSIHYSRKRDWLLNFKKDEDNANVIKWIDEYVDYLDKSIEDARIREERDRY